jgi:hypothetical protein
MRIGRTALALAALSLGGAGTAAASFGPPLTSVPRTLGTLPIVQLRTATARPAKSCSAHARSAPERIGRTERKLAPVACEQPPRSKAVDTGIAVFLSP